MSVMGGGGGFEQIFSMSVMGCGGGFEQIFFL